jgi:hypothetical protein
LKREEAAMATLMFHGELLRDDGMPVYTFAGIPSKTGVLAGVPVEAQEVGAPGSGWCLMVPDLTGFPDKVLPKFLHQAWGRLPHGADLQPSVLVHGQPGDLDLKGWWVTLDIVTTRRTWALSMYPVWSDHRDAQKLIRKAP